MSKIAIVSGGFDPVHSGHINLMLSAKELGDELIVLLNSDRWLENKKGKPFMNFFERKMVLENLWFVDKVLEFDDSDGSAKQGLEKIVKMYKPTDDLMFCNGGDRNSTKDIPEYDVPGIQLKFGIGGDTKLNSSSKLLDEYYTKPAQRDWGHWEVLKNYPKLGVKLKQLTVYPKQKTSLQKHFLRGEHWFVAQGHLKLNDIYSERVFSKNKSIHIPKGEWHQIENPSDSENLIIIEVQYGKKCIEDDIERRDDKKNFKNV